MDLETDVLFDSRKIDLLAKIVIGGTIFNHLNNDNLMICIKKIAIRMKDLTVDEKNENLQVAMDALNDLLYAASSHLNISGVD